MPVASLISTSHLREIFDEIVPHTFESLYFQEASPLPPSELNKMSGAEGIHVSIEMKATFTGTIQMFLSLELARGIVGSHFSASVEANNELIADAFSEILNTIAGRVAAAIAQSECSFDLSIPEISFGKVAFPKSAQMIAIYQVDFGFIGFTCDVANN